MSDDPVQGELVAQSAYDIEVKDFADRLQQAGQNRELLMKWIKANLVDGTAPCYPRPPEKARVQRGGQWHDNPAYDANLHAMKSVSDYGRIYTRQGWSKPTLFKAGAEKILGMMRFVAMFPNMDRYLEAAISGMVINQVVLKCEIINGHGSIVSQGIGAANVGEDLNKALKMAKKSALIDATLACVGVSEVFTQDLAPEPDGNTDDAGPYPGSMDVPVVAPLPEHLSNDKISQPQQTLLFARASKRAEALMEDSITKDVIVRDVLSRRGIEHTKQIPKPAFDKILKEVETWEVPGITEQSEPPF